jgi:hypothetical protein
MIAPEDFKNLIGVHEDWTKYSDGRVTVKRWFILSNETRKYLGEEETPYSEIPFVIMEKFEQAKKKV